jgi:hypothetical protein
MSNTTKYILIGLTAFLLKKNTNLSLASLGLFGLMFYFISSTWSGTQNTYFLSAKGNDGKEGIAGANGKDGIALQNVRFLDEVIDGKNALRIQLYNGGVWENAFLVEM